jgi:hypothetical protein
MTCPLKPWSPSLPPSRPPSLPPFLPGALTNPAATLLKHYCVTPLIFLTALVGGREEEGGEGTGGGRDVKEGGRRGEGEGKGQATLERTVTKVRGGRRKAGGRAEGRMEGGRKGGREGGRTTFECAASDSRRSPSLPPPSLPQVTPPPPSRMPPVGSTIPRCPEQTPNEAGAQVMPDHSWTVGEASNIKVGREGGRAGGRTWRSGNVSCLHWPVSCSSFH